jgi:hypothetical protein
MQSRYPLLPPKTDIVGDLIATADEDNAVPGRMH